MFKEIKFKGIRKDNGDETNGWGCYTSRNSKYFIINDNVTSEFKDFEYIEVEKIYPIEGLIK